MGPVISDQVFSNPEQFIGQSGIEYRFPFWMWKYWPKSHADQHLFGFYNAMVVPTSDTSWHSKRNYPLYLRPKFRLMRAIISQNIRDIDFCLDQLKVDINEELDQLQDRGFTAAVIAAKFDKLDMLHYLDMRGADLNQPETVEGNTPLMSAVINWQGRIVDYLLERGVDPFIQDKYGFTALQKAELRDLEKTAAILRDYEQKYKANQIKPKKIPQQVTKFRRIEIHKPYYYQKRISPETFLTLGVHPFSGRIPSLPVIPHRDIEIEYLGEELSAGIFGNYTKFEENEPSTFRA